MKSKKWLKELLVIAIGIMMVLSLAACGGNSGEEEASEEAGAEAEESGKASSDEASAAAYNKILETLTPAENPDGQLVVATSPDFAPMEFMDLSRSGDDQYVGFDVLLAKYMAKELNKELVIKPMSFDAVMAAVQTGNVDLGMSGFSWTEERAQNYFITDWYEAGNNETEQVVITKKDKEGTFSSPADFSGLKIGAQGASLQKVLVEGQLVPEGAEIMLYENLNDAVAALLTDKIDALAVAFGNGEAFISANPDDIGFSGFEFEVDDMYKNNVILVNQNNAELGEQVNEVLAKIKEENATEGWYEACQLLAQIKTIDELGYDDEGNKISE